MLQLENVTIEAGDFRLAGVSLSAPAGGYAVLMGATGSGKTSLIEAICGLRPAASGRVLLGGRDVTALPVAARRIGYVPQDCVVFPKMTVRENLAFAMMVRGQTTQQRAAKTGELAERLAIAHLLDRKAVGLSGGEAQRVALGRALAVSPEALLLDEPLSALDESTREEMIQLLRSAQVETGVTTLHVTHSRREAEQLADVVFEIVDGRVEQRDAAQTRAGVRV